jgi:hypothetical protein
VLRITRYRYDHFYLKKYKNNQIHEKTLISPKVFGSYTSVLDRKSFEADPDTDPNFLFSTDPDSELTPGPEMTNMVRYMIGLKQDVLSLFFFLMKYVCNYRRIGSL